MTVGLMPRLTVFIPGCTAWMAAMGLLLLTTGNAQANNIAVSNVAMIGQVEDSHWMVRFDVQWENSWRKDSVTPYNYDAAWIFVKWRNLSGVTGEWNHATLGTNAADHLAPTGSTIAVGLSGGRGAWGTNGLGVFLYRSTNGAGTFTANQVKLRWNYAADGAGGGAQIELKVCAIEMAYVPEGAFYAGSTNGTESGRFHDGASSNMPYCVTNEEQISVSNQPNCLWGASTNGNNTIGPEGVLSNAYPKGYAAFYGMKYEISQQQYVDFLNTLTPAQAAVRYPNSSPTNRHAITGVDGVYTSSLPYVGCNFVSWADVIAYADWAALRPMTELEYEKACRGTNAPVADEYAWGNINIVQATNFTNAGQADEAPQPAATANCVYTNFPIASVPGPLRVGCMGVGTGSRERTGAGYYGMMELSGNLLERTVAVGTNTGRAFTGLHGDGMLNTSGNADVTNWPAANGGGFRGASWIVTASGARVADRSLTANTNSLRFNNFGGRVVRSAP